jgi:hypothetical protein
MAIQKTRTDIVNFALDLLGVKAANEDAQDADMALGTKGLDDLVKSYQATGSHLWNRRTGYLFLYPAQYEYTIGPQTQQLSTGGDVDQNTLDHATEEYTESAMVNAVLVDTATLELPGTLNVTCDEDSVIFVGDFFGVMTSTGWWWSKVKVITPPDILLEDDFPEGLAAATDVVWYTTDMGKALRIPDMRREQGTGVNLTEIPMGQLARSEYLELPNKRSSGTPVQYYFNPQINTGEMFLWPVPSISDRRANFTFYKPIAVFDNSASAADFPDEWIAALKYNLAVYLAPAFGGRPIAPETMMMAEKLYQTAYTWDQGDSATYFTYGDGRGGQ